MAGRYTGSYLDRSYGWRAIAILADIGQSFTRRMHPHHINYDFASAAATSLLDAHERGLGPFRLPLRGEPDRLSEPLYVADVPVADLISLGPGATSRITQAKSLPIKAEQHAGHRGVPMPRRLDFGGHQVDVLETLDQWYGPDYRYIKVRGTDGGLLGWIV